MTNVCLSRVCDSTIHLHLVQYLFEAYRKLTLVLESLKSQLILNTNSVFTFVYTCNDNNNHSQDSRKIRWSTASNKE